MCCPLMMILMIQIRSLAMPTKFTRYEEEEFLKERGRDADGLPIDSVRRSWVALIEDWGPVTNTPPPFNIASPLFFHTVNSSQFQHITHMVQVCREVQGCSAARFAPRGNSSPLSALLPLQRVRHTTFHYS